VSNCANFLKKKCQIEIRIDSKSIEGFVNFTFKNEKFLNAFFAELHLFEFVQNFDINLSMR